VASGFAPEALEHLRDLEAFVSSRSDTATATKFIATILDHIDRLEMFPLAGRDRFDIRPGLRTTTFRKRTVVAYALTGSAEGTVISILGVFHGGRAWEDVLQSREEDQ
jgi:plasmid stabilization system protein ParE